MSLLTRLLRALLTLALCAALLVGGLWALAHNEAVTVRVLPMLPGVSVLAPSGALLGDFKAKRIDVALPRGGRLTLLEPAWQGLQIELDLQAACGCGLSMQRLSASRLELVWVAGAPSKPAAPPTDMGLPLSVRVQHLQIGQAVSKLWGDAPLTDLRAAVWLQKAQAGPSMPAAVVRAPKARGALVVHQIELAHMAWQGWALSGRAQMGVSGSLPVQGRLTAQGQKAGPAGPVQAHADVTVQGPLSALAAQGDAQWQREGGSTPQRLHVDAVLAPFAAWPVSRLRMHGQGVNLADAHASLPQTALQGEVLIEPAGRHDLRALVDVRNAMPGAWDAQRLPLRQLKGQISVPGLQVASDLMAALHEGQMDLDARLPGLAGAAMPAGEAVLRIQGGWGGQRSLRADWQGLAPQALHGQAPPLWLQGQALLKPQWQGGLQALATLRAGVSVSTQGRYLGLPAGQRGLAKGRDAAAPARAMAVSLVMDGQIAPGRLEVSALTLRADDALAELEQAVLQWGQPAKAQAMAPADWQVKGRVRVQAFDPQVWLPWPASVRGRNALSGQFDVALDARWRGLIQAQLRPSWLGGVPLSGQAQWRSPQDRPLMSLLLDLDAGGNTLHVQADLPWRLGPQGDMQWLPQAQWQARIHAPALQALQPVAPLLGMRQVGGLIEGQASAQGAWPAFTSSGQLSVSKLQWLGQDGTPASLASAKADWQVDTRSLDGPARVRLDLAQGQVRLMRLEQARWTLDGSARAHRSQLSVALSQQSRVGGKASAYQLDAAVQGGWQAQLAGWQGQFSELVLRSVGHQPRVWLQAQPFAAQWRHDAHGQSLSLGTTSLNVMGAVLNLQKLAWQRPAGSADAMGDTELQLQLAPLSLAAVMATWQPKAGWGGDLMLGGYIKASHRAQQPWVVDAEVVRQSGDISLIEPTIEGNSAQRLGIRTARVALQARDGVWVLTEHFDGRVLGVIKGRQLVRAAAADRLPAAGDALSGDLDMQVSNLRPWGAWVPAGWRLGGQLQAQAAVSGTLGSPQYRGQVKGQGISLGQALLGVNLTDGQLQMDLQGDHLHLTQLTARSGAQGGSLTAQGQASFGEQPQATLQIKADRFAVLQRVDRKVVISGEAQAALGEGGGLQVLGRVKVDEGLIDISRADAPTVGDDVNVLNREGQDPDEEADATTTGSGSKRKVNMALDVDLGRQLRLKGRGLDAFLTGALRVSTPANKLAVQGAVKVENGSYAAYGQKLAIERGSVVFTGPMENPRLDILAMRPQSPTAASSDVKVGVSITGTALDPRVRLYSDPTMSETEKLSWLVLGRGPTGLGGADIGLLQSAAVALLSGEGGSPSDNLVAALGLDELSVRQSEGTVRDTVVNVGKQVSRLWYVGYERSLNATSGNWQLIYRLAQRFMVRAQAGDDNAVDFIWSWRWD